MKSFLTLLIVLLIFSNQPEIVGAWIYKTCQDKTCNLEKVEKLDRSKYCIEFLPEGKLRVNQNGIGCGTPPIKYKVVEGSWQWISKSVVEIQYLSWTGEVLQKLKIKSVSDSELIIERF